MPPVSPSCTVRFLFLCFCRRGWGGGVDGRPCRTAASAASYEPSISWDGLALDPRPFARFDEHNTLALTKKPVSIAHASYFIPGTDQSDRKI